MYLCLIESHQGKDIDSDEDHVSVNSNDCVKYSSIKKEEVWQVFMIILITSVLDYNPEL